jgi:hypothetical protein
MACSLVVVRLWGATQCFVNAMFYRPNAATKGGTTTDVVAGYSYKADIKVQSLNDRKTAARCATAEPLKRYLVL